MTWQAGVSVIAFLVMYYQVWQIETYFGGCGTPVMGWLFNATVVGAIGSAIALRPLLRAWRKPGFSYALTRVLHLTMIAGFAAFLLRFFAYPYLRYFLER
jgi:hypothetical protein